MDRRSSGKGCHRNCSKIFEPHGDGSSIGPTNKPPASEMVPERCLTPALAGQRLSNLGRQAPKSGPATSRAGKVRPAPEFPRVSADQTDAPRPARVAEATGIARDPVTSFTAERIACAIRNATNGAVVHGKPGTVRRFASSDAEWRR